MSSERAGSAEEEEQEGAAVLQMSCHAGLTLQGFGWYAQYSG